MQNDHEGPSRAGRPPTVNGRVMKNEEELKSECTNKGHDLICPKIWFRVMQSRGCVNKFSGLESNTEYETVRSEELAYSLHMEKMEKGVMDLQPIAPAAYWMGVGVAGVGVGVAFAGAGAAGYGIGFLVQCFKKQS